MAARADDTDRSTLFRASLCPLYHGRLSAVRALLSFPPSLSLSVSLALALFAAEASSRPVFRSLGLRAPIVRRAFPWQSPARASPPATASRGSRLRSSERESDGDEERERKVNGFVFLSPFLLPLSLFVRTQWETEERAESIATVDAAQRAPWSAGESARKRARLPSIRSRCVCLTPSPSPSPVADAAAAAAGAAHLRLTLPPLLHPPPFCAHARFRGGGAVESAAAGRALLQRALLPLLAPQRAPHHRSRRCQ